MHEYEYVTKEEYGPVKNRLIELIKETQDELRGYFSFQYIFVGSSSRHVITREINGNRGYDFDVDLKLKKAKTYNPFELKQTFMDALNPYSHRFGFGFCKDSSSVITIKALDLMDRSISFSCDFAIVRDIVGKDGNTHHLYVYNDKEKNEYRWQERSKEYTGLKEKEEKIKQAGLWDDVREIYLEKKCLYSDDKKSRALYAETINEVFQLLENRRNK